MASGVEVTDEAKKAFEKIRTRYQGENRLEQDKLLVFRVSDDKSSIIVDEECSLKVKDVQGQDVFKKITGQFPPKDCRYAIYDCNYETKDSPKDDLIFIMWAPEEATIKTRMLYASSKSAIKKCCPGLKIEWQVNDATDMKDPSVLLERLGGKVTLKALEGKAL